MFCQGFRSRKMALRMVQELAHARYQGDLGLFAGVAEVFVVCADRRIPTTRREGGHVQGATHDARVLPRSCADRAACRYHGSAAPTPTKAAIC